jgi:ABC-type multidrug transport system ATPase subunit
MSAAPATQLEAVRVGRRFGSLVALDDVSLAVHEGEVVGLVGSNGAGKTTLIRILLGLLPPTTGSVSLFGQAPTRRGRARVGYVPQLGGLYDDLTVAENVTFARRAYGTKTTDAGVLGGDLQGVSGSLVADLSLGLRRRVGFSVAMAHEPGLLVLDEPTSGVDPLQRVRLWDQLRAAAARGIGVLVTTHHMSEAAECDQLVVLSSGRVVARGTQRAIVGDLTVVEVEVEAWATAFAALDAAGLTVALQGKRLRVIGADLGRVSQALRAAGIPAEAHPAPATLDEVFVRLATTRA